MNNILFIYCVFDLLYVIDIGANLIIFDRFKYLNLIYLIIYCIQNKLL